VKTPPPPPPAELVSKSPLFLLLTGVEVGMSWACGRLILDEPVAGPDECAVDGADECAVDGADEWLVEGAEEQLSDEEPSENLLPSEEVISLLALDLEVRVPLL